MVPHGKIHERFSSSQLVKKRLNQDVEISQRIKAQNCRPGDPQSRTACPSHAERAPPAWDLPPMHPFSKRKRPARSGRTGRLPSFEP